LVKQGHASQRAGSWGQQLRAAVNQLPRSQQARRGCGVLRSMNVSSDQAKSPSVKQSRPRVTIGSRSTLLSRAERVMAPRAGCMKERDRWLAVSAASTTAAWVYQQQARPLLGCISRKRAAHLPPRGGPSAGGAGLQEHAASTPQHAAHCSPHLHAHGNTSLVMVNGQQSKVWVASSCSQARPSKGGWLCPLVPAIVDPAACSGVGTSAVKCDESHKSTTLPATPKQVSR
jgi:hypothetical protein